MKILFIVNESEDSGIRVYADIVAKELNKVRGIHVVVDEKLGEKYDLVHVHSCRPENLARLKLYQPYTPVVTSTHMTSGELNGLVPDMVLSMIDLGLSTFYAQCEKVFVTAPHIMQELQKNPLLKKKLVFLPYPLDKNRLQRAGSKDVADFKKRFSLSGNKIVLCVGSVQYRKGVFDFAEMAKEFPSYQFVWVGKIPQLPYVKKKSELQSLVDEKKIKNLVFTGPLYGKELSAAYQSCDLFWLPSFSETFGLVIIEAALCGKPVLMRNIPVKELFKDFVVGYSSSPQEKIVSLLQNKKLSNKLKVKAKKKLEDFSIHRHVSKLVEEYRKVSKK